MSKRHGMVVEQQRLVAWRLELVERFELLGMVCPRLAQPQLVSFCVEGG